MSDVAHYAVRDGIAVISMNNPPVNGLSDALRAGIMESLDKADKDAAVKAVILVGAAKAFSGGADIREFNKPRNKPDLPDVNDRQDAMSKPLVAAIGGFALGGGLELALACHYRIALPKSQLGALIRDLRERFRLTVLLVEHHMGLVMSISERVVALNFGRLVAQGTPAEVREHPELVKAYLGTA